MEEIYSEFPPGFESEIGILAVDFDGVLHNNSKGFYDGTCYGEPIEGSIEAIKELSKEFRIVIFTAKAKANRPLVNGLTGQQHVLNWLKKHGLDTFVEEVTSEKPRAIAYIDDKAIQFTSWRETIVHPFLHKVD